VTAGPRTSSLTYVHRSEVADPTRRRSASVVAGDSDKAAFDPQK